MNKDETTCKEALKAGTYGTKKEEGLFILPLLILIPALTCSPANTLRSTIGDGALNCRVRHGTGCGRPSFGTGNFLVLLLIRHTKDL